MWNNSLYGNYRQVKFTDIYNNVDTFKTDFEDTPFAKYKVDGEEFDIITEDSLELLFYFLYSKFGNAVIASSDTNQFKFRLFATIHQYAPSWEKRLDIQNRLRALSVEEAAKGNKNISNHSFNPGTAPSTSSIEELETIDNQNTMTVKRGKIESLTLLNDMLDDSITVEFLNQFKDLFLKIVYPEIPLWYISGDEDDENYEKGPNFAI